MDPTELVRSHFADDVEFVGERVFCELAKTALSGGIAPDDIATTSDPGLRFDFQAAFEVLVPALTIAKLTLEIVNELFGVKKSVDESIVKSRLKERLSEDNKALVLLEQPECDAMIVDAVKRS